MTCSIVAVDPKTGESGFAIASCCFDAGQVCLAVPGVGAIASQAQGNMAFHRVFASEQAAGRTLQQTIDRFREIDPQIETRQVGMVTLAGETVAFTGQKCSYWAGHRTGTDYACQGNILTGAEVIESMAGTFEATPGSLFDRLFAALMAADAAGGDARGKQSARIMVSRKGAGAPGSDTVIDIRIEDHDNPIAEFRRLRAVWDDLIRIIGYVNQLARAFEGDRVAVLDELSAFLQDRQQPRYLDWWETLADGYINAGQRQKGLDAYRVYLGINPGMARIFRENALAGRFPEGVARELGVM